jgi:hypothetical protein
MTMIADTELILEEPEARTLAREAITRYRGDQKLTEATVRQGRGMWWMPSWWRFWLEAPVIRPERGEIWRRLYGEASNERLQLPAL